MLHRDIEHCLEQRELVRLIDKLLWIETKTRDDYQPEPSHYSLNLKDRKECSMVSRRKAHNGEWSGHEE